MDKTLKIINKLLIFVWIITIPVTTLANFPDQFITITDVEAMLQNAEEVSGITYNSDTTALQLQDGKLNGYIILEAQNSDDYFNRGLPSWNGSAPDKSSAFAVQMRFPDGDSWSPWLTVGFWKNYIWSSYGATSYAGGYIDYDYVKLNGYEKEWQFKIQMKRTSNDYPAPTIHRLSFFVSDTRTTNSISIPELVDDDPEEIFIDTDFLYQYDIDDQIGGSICSPTSVAMILKSYDIAVDPLDFARDTQDPYYGLFGVWPRVVQNASQYGLDGAVTRYRSWSAARQVLAQGGRIAMSVGPPLYSGHLMMLAGFDENGRPIVHDPAQSDGYAYKFSEYSLSKSWFDKGGIAYTFYPKDSSQLTGIENFASESVPLSQKFKLFDNYPNPFNNSTKIEFAIPDDGQVVLKIIGINGEVQTTLINGFLEKGYHKIYWRGQNYSGATVSSGIYFIAIQFRDKSLSKPITFIK